MAMVWKLQAVVVFSVSEETKFEVDTSLPSSFPRGVKFPLWKTRWQWILDLISATKILKCFKIKGSRKWRKRFKIENLLSWQNIFNSRQITADREKKPANQGKVLCGRISYVFAFPYQTNGNHATEPSTVGHVILRMALERYFRFYWNCKQLRVQGRKSVWNCEINFPIFSEPMHTILKTFSQHDLKKCI